MHVRVHAGGCVRPYGNPLCARVCLCACVRAACVCATLLGVVRARARTCVHGCVRYNSVRACRADLARNSLRGRMRSSSSPWPRPPHPTHPGCGHSSLTRIFLFSDSDGLGQFFTPWPRPPTSTASTSSSARCPLRLRRCCGWCRCP